jgi:hypothetical protein
VTGVGWILKAVGVDLTQVTPDRVRAFVLSFGMIPSSFAYVYLGSSLTDPKQIWKLLLAVVIIVGLMVVQRLPAALQKRKQDAAQAGAWTAGPRQTQAAGCTHG